MPMQFSTLESPQRKWSSSGNQENEHAGHVTETVNCVAICWLSVVAIMGTKSGVHYYGVSGYDKI